MMALQPVHKQQARTLMNGVIQGRTGVSHTFVVGLQNVGHIAVLVKIQVTDSLDIRYVSESLAPQQ